MSKHDAHLPRQAHNKKVASDRVSTSEKERKSVAAEQGWGTKADAKNAKGPR